MKKINNLRVIRLRKADRLLRIVECSESGKPIRVLGILGQERDMLKSGVIWSERPCIGTKWIVITVSNPENLYAYDTREDAIKDIKSERIPLI